MMHISFSSVTITTKPFFASDLSESTHLKWLTFNTFIIMIIN